MLDFPDYPDDGGHTDPHDHNHGDDLNHGDFYDKQWNCEIWGPQQTCISYLEYTILIRMLTTKTTTMKRQQSSGMTRPMQ